MFKITNGDGTGRIRLMVKPKEIRIIFLSFVYLMLLTSVVLPHHHHEEVACFTSNHCTTDADIPHHQAETPDGHHHDRSPGEASEHCISLEYYIVSHNGKDNRQMVNPSLSARGHWSFLHVCPDCPMHHPELETGEPNIFFASRNNYTVLLTTHIPLRAPPALLA